MYVSLLENVMCTVWERPGLLNIATVTKEGGVLWSVNFEAVLNWSNFNIFIFKAIWSIFKSEIVLKGYILKSLKQFIKREVWSRFKFNGKRCFKFDVVLRV